MENDAPNKTSRVFNRQVMAYLFMSIFVVASAAGAMMFNVGIGLMVLGATSGIYGYMLGKD